MEIEREGKGKEGVRLREEKERGKKE